MKPSDDLKRDIYTGKDCQTVEQISKECGLSESTIRTHARKMVRAGIWKEVKVLVNGKRGLIAAYIKVK